MTTSRPKQQLNRGRGKAKEMDMVSTRTFPAAKGERHTAEKGRCRWMSGRADGWQGKKNKQKKKVNNERNINCI